MRVSSLLIALLFAPHLFLLLNSILNLVSSLLRRKRKKKKNKKSKKKKDSCKNESPSKDKNSSNQIESWNGPNWKDATNLSHLGSFKKNLSGAHWDSKNERLYAVVNNPATVYELSLVDGEFTQTSKISARGDYEGVTMRSDDLSKIYVLGEGCECIIEYDMSSKKKVRSWSLPSLPTRGGNGPEGIAFIKNEFLDSSIGLSSNGMGGLFVVAHQNGGELFFDLDENTNKVSLVKKLKTRASESSGLEFDESEENYIFGTTSGLTLLR